MNKTKITLLAGAAVVIAAGLVIAVKMNTPASTSDARGAIGIVPNPTRELNPYNHVASIPATVDPSSIRFEKVKMVDLASKTQTTSDPQDCKERQFRDPDGQGCEAVKVLERVKAVEAEYSYIGPQVTTGEGEVVPASRQTFAVYFRPEEVAAAGAVENLNREQAGSLFEISTSRPIVQEKVIDRQNSRFCEGKYADGVWMASDPKCREQVEYTTRTVPSEYWAVEVNLRHPAIASNR
jgi:hypothetical protein